MSFLSFSRPQAVSFAGEDLREPWNCAFCPLTLTPHVNRFFLGPIFIALVEVCKWTSADREALAAQSLLMCQRHTVYTHSDSPPPAIFIPSCGPGCQASVRRGNRKCLSLKVQSRTHTTPGADGTRNPGSGAQGSWVLIPGDRLPCNLRPALSPGACQLPLFLNNPDSSAGVSLLFLLRTKMVGKQSCTGWLFSFSKESSMSNTKLEQTQVGNWHDSSAC